MKYTTFTLCLFLAVAYLSSCKPQLNPQTKDISVKTYECQAYSLDQHVTYSGKVKADLQANVAFRISGPIVNIPVKVGDHVKKGALLAQMDDRDYKLQLSATQAEYDGIKAQADRVIELYRRGSANQSDYEKATYGLQQITSKLKAHTNSLKDTRLTAPFDAVVEKILYRSGETVGAGYPVISLISSSVPVIQISVPQHIKENLDNINGITARIGKRGYSMTIGNCSEKANLNQLYELDLKFKSQEIQDRQDYPSVGLAANVEISFKAAEIKNIYIPVSSLFTDSNGKSCVWVVENDTVSLRHVTVSAIQKNDLAVIVSGLQSNEIIVSAGVSYLHDGQKVKPVAQNSETNIGHIL